MREPINWATLALALLPISGATTPPTLAAQGQVTVTIPSGTIVGTSVQDIESFNGIPFADPPTDELRFKPPRKLSTHLGTFDATGVAKLCPQGLTFSPSPISNSRDSAANEALRGLFGDAQPEDCLTVTIHRPRGTQAGDNLPVLFYIFGGGFISGGTSTATNDPTTLVQTGIDLDKPFIFAAVNYRLAGWGFMPGAEILRDGSANAGLLDQRMGLEWIADNIAAFGGDPAKVTIWGQSAGAISVFDQMVLYDGNATHNGKPLFRAAIMNSGSVTPTEPVDSAKSQALYEHVVKEAKCEGADSLACLRGLSYQDFAAAANSVLSYRSMAISYLPRPDGKALSASPHMLAREGKIHAVPMIFGTQEDEGTIFSLFQKDMGSTDKITDYLKDLYFHNANESLIKAFVDTYSERIEDGSPYRTGTHLGLLPYPGSKRVASILGDVFFILIRRWTLDIVAAVRPGVPLWSSFASYDHLVSPRGTQHGSDTSVFFGRNNSYYPSRSGRTYYINFVHNTDPNVGLDADVFWPKWTERKQLLWYNASENGLLKDDFRAKSYDVVKEHIDELRY